MSIRLYLQNQHPAGFIGLRVARTINKKLYQKYFSFNAGKGELVSEELQNILWAEAKILEEKWRQESKEVQYQRYLNEPSHKTKKGRGLGFTGITICFDKDEKNASDHFYPSFRVACRSSFQSDRLVRISKYGFSKAWQISVDLWAEAQGVTIEDKDRLLQNPPSPDVFKELRRQLNIEGWDIPTTALRAVYSEQRVSLKKQALQDTSDMEDSLKEEISTFLRKRSDGTIRF